MIKFVESEVVKKAWGEEVILHNDKDYCGKLLRFKEGSKFSMHFHSLKSETWYVNKGSFKLIFIDTNTAERSGKILISGYILDIGRNTPHQLIALEDSEIFEISTQHFDNDSYRVEKGDSQKPEMLNLQEEIDSGYSDPDSPCRGCNEYYPITVCPICQILTDYRKTKKNVSSQK
jgi:quercetin dioxygenase-like cupin family protein